MKQRRKHKANTSIGILLVDHSSLNRRGRRVLVRDHGVENWIWAEDGVSEADRRLLGLSERDQEHIESFFGGYNVYANWDTAE